MHTTKKKFVILISLSAAYYDLPHMVRNLFFICFFFSTFYNQEIWGVLMSLYIKYKRSPDFLVLFLLFYFHLTIIM